SYHPYQLTPLVTSSSLPATATPELYTLPYTTLFRSWFPLRRMSRVPLRPHRPPRTVSASPPFVLRIPHGTLGNRTSGLCAKTVRSEEHTSELQSRFDLVCRVLLERKKLILAVMPPRH